MYIILKSDEYRELQEATKKIYDLESALKYELEVKHLNIECCKLAGNEKSHELEHEYSGLLYAYTIFKNIMKVNN